ncbi:hypothetical protein [Pedobacter frigoris]|uniref:hypothetical protein n=1 Tax=Pedobacter frigoris TaxID=2571272 RepID=UPI0029317DB1|nr:hypothetical protein [Pedobacter frigoris]
MVNQLTTSGDGLRLFFTDDVYLVNEPQSSLSPKVHVVENEEVVSANAEVVTPVPVMIAEPAAERIQAIVERIEFKYLGKNQRNILILVNDANHEVSDENGRELLRKIVKSVNLSANDFALLNYHNYQKATYRHLMDHFSSTIIFAFGVSPLQLELPAHPENTVIREDGVMMIFSAELKRLHEDQHAKKTLWGSLKQLGL